MSNRRRRPRYTQPINRHHRPAPPTAPPEGLYSIGFYDPDGEEIEITIDVNDLAAHPMLVDLIHLMTDNCPLCNDHRDGDQHGQP